MKNFDELSALVCKQFVLHEKKKTAVPLFMKGVDVERSEVKGGCAGGSNRRYQGARRIPALRRDTNQPAGESI